MRALLVALSFCIAASVSAQISFYKPDNNVGDGFRSGSAVLSIDINGDTYDDLVRLHEGTLLNVHLLGAPNEFIGTWQMDVAGNPEWNLVAGDINNDGWVDISSSGASSRVKVMYAQPGSHSFEAVNIANDFFLAQGANMVDANNDGYLDLFVCNDNGSNYLYLNDTLGAFYQDTHLIDVNTVPPSDNSGNYGSTWADFDFDGDLDLYLSKCRIGVFDPADPRRINMLYVQNDTGYLEMADSFGLADGAQSWSSDLADIDNDGDFDIFILNHDFPSVLWENKGGGEYEDITEQAGVGVSGLKIQSIFRDFDNDGLLDLLITGNRSIVFRNMGGNVFEEVYNPFPGRAVSSNTVGDFNGDGFYDVYATYNILYNTPSSIHEDALWLNRGNDNNYFRVKLLSPEKNTTAVGAKLMLYTPDMTQLREIRAGESYGIGTSQTHIFGLGQNTEIDSLVIMWPDGTREQYTGLMANTTMHAVQGQCITEPVDLGIDPLVQCGSDTFELIAPPNYEYRWSNGDTTQSISVSATGVYHVSLTNSDGCMTVSLPVLIKPDESSDEDSIQVISPPAPCYGDSVVLSAPDGVSYEWVNGATTQQIVVTETAMYSVVVTRECNELIPPPVTVEFIDANSFETQGDTLEGQGMGTLTATGDSILWYDSEEAVEAIASGNVYITPEVDTTTTYYAEQVLFEPGTSAFGGMEDHPGGPLYHSFQVNGGLIFDIHQHLTLDSVKVLTEFEGDRTIEIYDREGTLLLRRSYPVASGTTYLQIGLELPAGEDYLITTNVDSNQAALGFTSPLLASSEEEVAYPYVTEDYFTITGSPRSQELYYYFFDWHVSTSDIECRSQRKPATVVIDSTTSTRAPGWSEVIVYPNPVRGDLLVQWSDASAQSSFALTIRHINGQIVKVDTWYPGDEIDVRQIPDGMFVLELVGEDERYITRFVKVR